jgi:hypothetical protein
VNEFVEACRREWRRLGVPDPVANEMAFDLAADLREAEAEGVAPEEVLGSGAFDPESFARAWAQERGVVGPQPPAGRRFSRRSRYPYAVAAFALVALVGAALLTASSRSGTVRLALPAPVVTQVVGPGVQRVRISPALPLPRVGPPVWWQAAGPPRLSIVPVPRRVVLPSFSIPVGDRGPAVWDVAHALGLVLLILGLAGIVGSALLWARRRPLA